MAIQEVEEKVIIVVEIIPGMQRPYYIQSQGIMEGTYIRVAGSTRHAQRYRVQELIMEGTNRSYDQMELEESISDEDISVFCDKLYDHAIELCSSDEMKAQIHKVGKNQLLSWKLLVEKEGVLHPTNGYMLLDGKSNEFSEATIQCAVFKGTVRDIFITRKEFVGSIYEQIDEAYEFVLQHINLGSRIEGVARQDYYELPIKTIREIISNGVCHRSYLTPGKIQVALFDDRLEVTSPGMLDSEITIEKMKTGLSKIRNKGIAAAFSYMNVVEAWGSGIAKMFREAKEYGLREPELIDMGSDFRVNLYRKAADVDANGVINPKGSSNNATNSATDATNGATDATNSLTEDEKKVIEAIRTKSDATQKEMQAMTGITLGTIKRILPRLQAKGLIERIGNRRFGKWQINDLLS